MQVKNKINYWKLVKSSRDLLKNKNFRNNQNYIISDFSKFRFSSKYYRSTFLKYINKTLVYLMYLFVFIVIFIKNIDNDFLINLLLYFLLILIVLFWLLILILVFKETIYFYYKKFNFIKRRHIFASDRYIFFKNPKKKAYRLNRRDFISFKK